MSALDAFRAAFGDWNSLTDAQKLRGQMDAELYWGVDEGIQHDAAATGNRVSGSTLTCLDCGSEWEHHELLRIKESHGEVLLYCPGCQSGEIE